MSERVFGAGGHLFSLGELLLIGVSALLAVLLIVLLVAWRRAARRADESGEVEARMAELVRGCKAR